MFRAAGKRLAQLVEKVARSSRAVLAAIPGSWIGPRAAGDLGVVDAHQSDHGLGHIVPDGRSLLCELGDREIMTANDLRSVARKSEKSHWCTRCARVPELRRRSMSSRLVWTVAQTLVTAGFLGLLAWGAASCAAES